MTPPSGAVIGFITFIASTISSVSPAFTASPTWTKGSASGCGERKAVPTIGDLIVVPETSSTAGSWAAGAAAGGGGAAAAGAGGRAAGRAAYSSRATLI